MMIWKLNPCNYEIASNDYNKDSSEKVSKERFLRFVCDLGMSLITLFGFHFPNHKLHYGMTQLPV